MLKSLTKLTRRIAFGAALLAGIAGFAGQANAAAGDAQAITTAGSSVALQAPFTTAFVAGYGQQVRLNVTLDAGTGAEVDFMALYAFLYQNGTYVAAIRSDTATSGANAKTQVVLLPQNNSPFTYNQVAFAYLNVGADGGITANATPDTLNGTSMATRVLRIRPDQIAARTGAAGVGLSAVAVGAYTVTSTSSGPSGGQVTGPQLAAIGGAAGMTSNLLSMSSYAGPVLQSAGTVSLSAGLSTDVKLTFNTALAAIGNNNTVAVTNLQVDVNDNTGRVTAAQTQGAVSAGDYVVRFDDTDAFNNTLVSIDLNPIALGACVTDFIRDEAGNCAAATTAFPIAAFAAPRFSTTGTAKVMLTGGAGVDEAAEIAALYTTAGTIAGTTGAGVRFTFTTRMAENFNGVGINNVDDYTYTPAAFETLANGTNVNTSGANASTFTTSVDVNAGDRVRVNSTTGAVQYSADAGVTWTDITFNLAVGATALTTAELVALSTAPTAVTTYSAITPASPTVATRDANVDGILDGVTITFGTDVTGVNSTGFAIFDRDIPATNASAVTVAADSLDAAKVNITGVQATIQAYKVGAETDASVLNTGATSATPIPYDFSLTSATTTYARVYNSTSGNLQTVPDFAAAGTISDGAGPALLSVSRVLGESALPEGTLSLRFSETMLAGATSSTVSSTPGGTLFGQILSLVDDNNAVGTATLATFTGSAITNDSLVFSNVDNDVLSSLTAVGVSSANASIALGSSVRDANGNRAGVQSVTPGAATTVTNIAPAFDRAVAVVDSNQNITNVLVFLTKNVTLTGTNLQNQFSFSINGGTVAPVSATVTGNIVNLALASPGLPLAQVLLGASDTVTYTNNGVTVYLADSNNNQLATFGAPQAIDLPQTSEKLFTMDVRGNVKTAGSTNVAQGTIIRADLMRFDASRVIDRGSVKVPCISCGSSVSDVEITTYTGIQTLVDNAAVTGDTTFPAWVKVTADQDGRKTVALQDTSAGAGAAITIYQVSVNRTTGAITSTGSAVTGQITFRNGPISLSAVDSARYAIVNGTDGNFRVNVGTNDSYSDAFVIISVRQNGTATSSWVPVTFADPSLAGYLPFNQDVKVVTAAGQSDSPFIDFENVGGGNGVVTANFVLSNIKSVDLAQSTNYQLVGLPGQLARNSSSLNDFKAYRLFTTIDTSTGAPRSMWAFGAGSSQEAFTLVGNSVKSSFSLNNVNIENIKNALVSMYGVAFKDVAGRVSTLDNDTLFYPVSAATASDTNLAAGWHLVTVQADQASPGFLGNTSTDNTAVGMIIEAGVRRNGTGLANPLTNARTWIRGASDNSLTSLVAGRAYFVYLSAADSTFTGR